MTKDYPTQNDLEKTPRPLVLKRILAFSKSYKNSVKDTKINISEN